MKKGIHIFHFLLCLFFVAGISFSLKAQDDSLKIKSIKTEYNVALLEGINTKQAEFCAIPYQKNLVFVTDQKKDLVNQQSKDANGIAYTDVFLAEIDHEKIINASAFTKKVNSEFHDGPIAFNNDESELYLTRVEYLNKKTKKYVNKAKLYLLKKTGNDWSNPVPFKYNNDSYSVGHASVSNDGNYLFFSSDMPGGKGGKDIYVCKKEGDNWGTPENLGSEVNTEGDEEFPYIRKDDVLFFSSNGHKGLGGFDIYSATHHSGAWHTKRNEGSGINSDANDFGIVFTDSIRGYFTSNRTGGIGMDDIYKFTLIEKSTNLRATLLLTENLNNPAKSVQVYLMDSTGRKVDSTITTQNGFFQFKNLLRDEAYMVSVEDNNIDFKEKARFYLANESGEVVNASQPFKKNLYTFKNLPFDKTTLPDLYPEGDLTLSGGLSHGKNPSIFIKNAIVTITNSFGYIVDSAKTNEFGIFVFNNLLKGQDYTFNINDASLHLPSGTEVVLTDRFGKVIKSFIIGKGNFEYKILAFDKSSLESFETDFEEISILLKGYVYNADKKPLKQASLRLTDSKNNNNEIAVSDSLGRFQFNYSNARKYEFLEVTTNNDLDSIIYIADSKGRILRKLKKNKEGKYKYKLLEVDKTILGEYTVDDPWLYLREPKKSNESRVIENILYETNSFKLDSIGKLILNKVISVLKNNPDLKIELSSYTDSRADDQYNLKLSNKRAQYAVEYIVSKGVNKKRLKAIGYGETKPLNKCLNEIPCTNDEFSINRRTELKIIFNK